MQPETPPPLPPMPPSAPPVGYPVYAPPPPPPKGGIPVWVWIVLGVVGVGGCFFVLIFAAILFPVFAQARAKAREVSCLSNQKQIALGLMMYAQDYDERLPAAATWHTDMEPYVRREDVFHCPAVQPSAGQTTLPANTYAYNSALDRMKMARLASPMDTVLTYDSTDFSQNANDALTSLPTPGRHGAENNISFADGHAKHWPDSEPLPKGEILPDTP